MELQGFDRLTQGYATVQGIRGFEPHSTKRRVNGRFIREPLGRASQGQHGRVCLAPSGVGQTEVDEPCGARWFECRERLTLFQRLLTAPSAVEDGNHLVARGGERRTDLDGTRQRAQCFLVLPALAEAHTEQIEGLGEVCVQLNRTPQPTDGAFGVAAPVVGERQLVQDAWRAVVQCDKCLVVC